MVVKPGETFEVVTQMNRGPDVSDVPENIRKEWMEVRRGDMRSGNPSSGAIYVEGAEPGQGYR